MIVTFSVKGVWFEDDIIEKEYTILDKYDYVECKQQFADEVGVDYSRVNDDLDPVDYIDLFGITFFGDRGE